MDRLPKEIVQLIITDFTFEEKLECALVNRKWLMWIRETSLYKQLTIEESPNKCEKIINYFEKNKYGRLVSNLSIKNCELTLMALLNLPEIFPNIKNFTWIQDYEFVPGDYSIYAREVNTLQYERQIQKWQQLQFIKEKNKHFPITTAILKSPASAVNLKSISITCFNGDLATSPDEIQFHQDISVILKHIKNATNLESLKLENFLITWNDMNQLHAGAKKLSSLIFKNMFLRAMNEYSDEEDSNEEEEPIACDSDENQESIAENLESFQIIYDQDIFEIERGDLYWWTRYIAKKYRNIVSFSLTYNNWVYMPISATSFEETMMYCFPNWPKLKKYDVKMGHLSKALLDVMDHSQIALDEITIYIEDGSESIEQYKNLMYSNQIKSIHTLRIIERGRFSSDDEEYGTSMFALLRTMPNLRHVILDTHFGSAGHHDPSIIANILNNALHIELIDAPYLLGPPETLVTVDHYSKLLSMNLTYIQFNCVGGTEMFNKSMKNILSHCPLLESFKTHINIFGAAEGAKDTTMIFDFRQNPNIKSICILTLYEATFKIVRSGIAKYYFHDFTNTLVEIPEKDKKLPYITVIINNNASFTTKVLSL